jgi:hypothetical protein
MNLPFTGGCICGDIRYECTALPFKMVNCHCRDCQQVTGGPYAPVLAVTLDSFKITKGVLQHYATTRVSGRPNLRGFCPRCGAPLTVGDDPARNMIGIMASSLDDPKYFIPTADIFVTDAQAWDHMDPQLPKHLQYLPRVTND